MIQRKRPTPAGAATAATFPEGLRADTSTMARSTRDRPAQLPALTLSDGRVSTVNRELAVAEPFGRGLLARSNRQHFVEQAVCRLVQRLGVRHHATDFEIQVVGHLPRGA